MPIFYKMEVLEALKEKGISTYNLRKEKILSESTIQALRSKKPISWENLEKICGLLDCQPADIIEYVADGVQENK